jgi:hypothetical protein
VQLVAGVAMKQLMLRVIVSREIVVGLVLRAVRYSHLWLAIQGRELDVRQGAVYRYAGWKMGLE